MFNILIHILTHILIHILIHILTHILTHILRYPNIYSDTYPNTFILINTAKYAEGKSNVLENFFYNPNAGKIVRNIEEKVFRLRQFFAQDMFHVVLISFFRIYMFFSSITYVYLTYRSFVPVLICCLSCNRTAFHHIGCDRVLLVLNLILCIILQRRWCSYSS